MNTDVDTGGLVEVQRLFTKAWNRVLQGTVTLTPTFDPAFPGFYCRAEDVGIAMSGKHYTVGHMDSKGGFIPNAGPFDSPAAAVIVAIGMIANGQASRAVHSGD